MIDPNIIFFYIMFTLGCILAAGTLIYVIIRALDRGAGEIGGWELRGAGRRMAAVARTTIAEGLRAKVVSGFVVMIVVAIPFFWLTAEGDGTIKGRVQMFMTYSLGFTGFVLALVTIFLSCRSLSAEIAGRQIYAIVSKPVPRWQILGGKWLGVMLLDAAMLMLAFGMTYTGVQLTLAQFKSQLAGELVEYGRFKPDEAQRIVTALDTVQGIGKQGIQSPVLDAFTRTLGLTHQKVADRLLLLPERTRVDLRRFDELRRQVLVSRAALRPSLPDLSEMIEEEFARMKKEDRLPEEMTDAEVRETIRNGLVNAYCSLSPGELRRWIMQGPSPERSSDFIMSVRFKVRAPGTFVSQSMTGMMLEEETLLCRWAVGDPRSPDFAELVDVFPTDTFNEFEIPTQSVADDGTVVLNFMNVDPRGTEVIFEIPKGNLEVLYRVGSFELNVFQALLAMLIPLGTVASFGILASTFLSFPVGSLIVLTLYIMASSIGFVAESLAATEEYAPVDPPLTWVFRRAVVDAIDWALSIGDVDPVNRLMDGRSIGWDRVGINFLKFPVAKGMAGLAIAVLVFRRREVAAVIV